MSENPQVQPQNLLDVCAALWRARVFVFVGALLGVFAAAGFMMSATPQYRAQMILSPANPMNGAEVSSLLADDNLFALRYLVQRVGVANSSDFMRFENTYAGPSVAELLLKDPAIVRGLNKDQGFVFSSVDEEWNAARLSEYVQDNVRLGHVGASPLRRISYRHPDPAFGVYFLQNIHRLTDEMIRMKIRQDAGQRVRYLEAVIEETENPTHKKALTSLLLEQERLRMLVSIESPYAASVIEPASVSAKTVWPDANLVYVLAVLIGAALGFVVFAFRGAAHAETVVISDAYQGPERRRYKPGKKYGYWWTPEAGNDSAGETEDEADVEAAE